MQPLRAWRVLDIREGSRSDEAGKTLRTRVVRYMVGKDGPFTLEMDAATFNGAAMEAALEAEAGHVMRLHPPT